jgi:hypothetical protein
MVHETSLDRARIIAAALASVTCDGSAEHDPRLDAASELLANALLAFRRPFMSPIAAAPRSCMNCDVPTELQYCTDGCRGEASLIRYTRAAIDDGRIRRIAVVRDGIGSRLLVLREESTPDRRAPARMTTLATRVASPLPLRVCDDARNWTHLRQGRSSDRKNHTYETSQES